ncbi:MAG TPA: hypothetical protein VKQ30_13765 [Ktedonobacterales bacterium]|nr:hypothetical protein [Ktedonobacterales bacterium]
MPIIIAILLGLSAMLIVIYPLLGLDAATASAAAGDDALADVTERERSAKMALRDVDFDYRLGNLEETDYDALRSRYERRALAALRTRYEREQALDRLIDEQLAAMMEKKSGKNGDATSLAPREVKPSASERPNAGRARPPRPTHTRRRKGGGL